MLIDSAQYPRTTLITKQTKLPDNSYPHYLIVPSTKDSNCCLLFYPEKSRYIILIPKGKKYQVIRKLIQFQRTAPYEIFEYTI